MVNANGYFANAGSNTVDLTLPITPAIGEEVGVIATDLTFTMRVLRNGEKIQGLAEDMNVNIDDASFTLIFEGATYGWRLFSLLVGQGPTGPTGASEITDPAVDHTATGLTATETVGESVVFGNLLYMKSDGKWWKADADAAATMPGMRLALATASADATCETLLLGKARDDSWAWTVGGLIYASDTSGAITQTAPSGSGDQVQVVGYAYHADKMVFQPSPVLAEVS